MQRQVSIIGLGNWGTALAHALRQAGKLHEVVVPRVRSAAGKSEPVRLLRITTLDQAVLEAGILWLCVPDSAIARVTRSLVKQAGPRGLKGKIVVHSSGALSARVLEPAARAGAAVAAVHPMMTFPERRQVKLQDVPFGIEADPATRRVLRAIIQRIGGRPFAIEAPNKTLYHLAGVMSSPLLVSHLTAAQELAELAGLNLRQAQQVIEPIARATLNNFFRQGARRSFSGPIARGDVATIRLHLQALKFHPMLADVYRSLALYAVAALPVSAAKQVRASLRRQKW
jgi:predicted short-subunit dehydrogenase-like oxidoreductase (DUF2520 family)